MSHVQGVQRLFFIVSPLSTVCMFSSVLGGMRYMMYIYNTRCMYTLVHVARSPG